jgi:hypothetical protein
MATILPGIGQIFAIERRRKAFPAGRQRPREPSWAAGALPGRRPEDGRPQPVAGQQRQLDLQVVRVNGTAETSSALRTRYRTVFLCTVSRSAVALKPPPSSRKTHKVSRRLALWSSSSARDRRVSATQARVSSIEPDIRAGGATSLKLVMNRPHGPSGQRDALGAQGLLVGAPEASDAGRAGAHGEADVSRAAGRAVAGNLDGQGVPAAQQEPGPRARPETGAGHDDCRGRAAGRGPGLHRDPRAWPANRPAPWSRRPTLTTARRRCAPLRRSGCRRTTRCGSIGMHSRHRRHRR